MVAIERGLKKKKQEKNMIKDCSRAKQLTEWVETTDKSKVIEFPSCLSYFLGQTSLHGGKERLWGFLARVGL